jgi:hypothetical protein
LSDKPLENCNVGRRKLGHQSVCSIRALHVEPERSRVS